MLNDTTLTTPWEIIDSMNSDGSNFSVITMNQSNVSQATVISKRSTKGKVLIYIHDLKIDVSMYFSIQTSNIIFHTHVETIYTETSSQRCEIRQSMRS